MGRLFSRPALIVAVSYAALVGVAMFLAWRVADPEGRTYDMLFIGFPWVLALITLRDHIAGDSLFRYFVALILNVATVYVLTLAVVRISTDDSK